MTHDGAFLADILAEPADDAPRLIYADWLEDQGRRERAEFIRLQIAKERDPAYHGSLCLPEGPCENCRRELQLLSPEKFWEWLAPYGEGAAIACEMWPGSPGVSIGRRAWGGALVCRVGYLQEAARPGWDFTIRRGFVSGVSLPHGEFLRHAESLFRGSPIEEVALADREPLRWDSAGEVWHVGDANEILPTTTESFFHLEEECFARHFPDATVPPGFPSLRRYPSGEAAPALSRACVWIGRSLAGLEKEPPP